MALKRGHGTRGEIGIQVVSVALNPRTVVVPIVAGPAGRHQVQARKLRVTGVEVVEHLRRELAHLAAGNNTDIDVVEQRAQRRVHAGGQR